MMYEWEKRTAIEKAKQYKIPDRMISPMLQWVLYGRQPESFLCAIIRNDLKGACQSADNENGQLLHAYVAWFHNWVPASAWGSPKALKTWKGVENVLGNTR